MKETKEGTEPGATALLSIGGSADDSHARRKTAPGVATLTIPPRSRRRQQRSSNGTEKWGKFSMVEAGRRLLANALLVFSNQRFVLLSESCIPLFNFKTICNYLIRSTTSFVESYDQLGPVGCGRYDLRMRPYVTLNKWRKGSQWFEIDRNLALEMLARMRTGTQYLYNGRPTRVCYLFARKFTVNALDRLIRFAPKIMEF
ncbi:hypothetical protein CDL12_13428 [Handroanthus impetiginosus]|uniref:Uncharacterized protein n=1 Tax=Handroanthus impetiginosus TaxID=429701 RepID=A0A2G9H8U2_9LAMI|nr:hypothetical protein CDL12_13428 [Handroanthus impetiginosus]